MNFLAAEQSSSTFKINFKSILRPILREQAADFVLGGLVPILYHNLVVILLNLKPEWKIFAKKHPFFNHFGQNTKNRILPRRPFQNIRDTLKYLKNIQFSKFRFSIKLPKILSRY